MSLEGDVVCNLEATLPKAKRIALANRWPKIQLLAMSQKDSPGKIMPISPASPQISTLRSYPASESIFSDEIHFRFEGIGSLCPITGQPDTATISVCYVSESLCLDEDSVWNYLCTFRNFPAFSEEVVNRILDDLVETANPRRMMVNGRFATRGGIALSAEARFPN